MLSASREGGRVVGYNDSGADTTMIGDNCIVLSTTDRLVTVVGFESAKAVVPNLPIVTAATAVDLPDGETVILIFNEAIKLPPGNNSLICINQVRAFGHKVDDIPHKYGGKQQIKPGMVILFHSFTKVVFMAWISELLPRMS